MYEEMDLKGYVSLLSTGSDNNLQKAVQTTFSSENLIDLMLFFEIRSKFISSVDEPFGNLLKDCFELESEEDIFFMLALKIKSHIKLFNEAVMHPEILLGEISRAVGTQFYLLSNQLTPDLVASLSPLLNFSGHFVVRFSNYLIAKPPIVRQSNSSYFFINFRGLTPSHLETFKPAIFHQTILRNVLDLNTIPEDLVDGLFSKVNRIDFLLLKLTRNRTLLEKTVSWLERLQTFCLSFGGLRLSWSEDSDLPSCMEMILGRNYFTLVEIYDESRNRSPIVANQKVLTDGICRVHIAETLIDAQFFPSDEQSFISLKPVLLELANRKFISKSPKLCKPLEFKFDEKLKSLLIYATYQYVTEVFDKICGSESSGLMKINVFSGMETQDPKVWKDFLQYLKPMCNEKPNDFFSTLSESIEEYLDIIDDWNLKSFFLENRQKLFLSALSMQRSYYTHEEFLFAAIKKLKIAVLTILNASSKGNLLDDEETKLIATPYFLWKSALNDGSLESEKQFLSVTPYLKAGSILKINLHDHWLKYVPPCNPLGVDFLLIEIPSSNKHEIASRNMLYQWLTVEEKSIALMTRTRNIQEEDVAANFLFDISSFWFLKISGIILSFATPDFLTEVARKFGDSIVYLSFLPHVVVFTDSAKVMLNLVKLHTVSLKPRQSGIIHFCFQRFLVQQLQMPFKLQIRDIEWNELASIYSCPNVPLNSLRRNLNSFSRVFHVNLGQLNDQVRFKRTKNVEK